MIWYLLIFLFGAIVGVVAAWIALAIYFSRGLFR